MRTHPVALAVADRLRLRDGVCFVDLAPLADDRLVSTALASALGVGVASDDPLPGLVALLRERHAVPPGLRPVAVTWIVPAALRRTTTPSSAPASSPASKHRQASNPAKRETCEKSFVRHSSSQTSSRATCS